MEVLPQYLKQDSHGQASENSIVRGRNYRFTVLTSKLIRMEYDPEGVFEDRATQSVVNRVFPAVEFTTEDTDEAVTITTAELRLHYCKTGAFDPDNLSVRLLNNPGRVTHWHFSNEPDDLGGTARTLDEADGAVPLGHGVCSKDGYAILDDSTSLLIGADGWIYPARKGTTDVYFFGYGHQYTSCIQDYYRLTGVPPMLPDYALGNWWSRYHEYTQAEYQNLLERFSKEDIPFSVAVVDMDWHRTQIPGHNPHYGWTGYSWNTDLFPDYKGFIRWLHDRNYKTSLNLHPADGVRPHEDMYPQMAAAMSIDQSAKETIPFDMTDPKFVRAYFDVLHHPYEADGVDFWWIDWQQGEKTKLEGLDPLWILNHFHTLDIARNGKRPMIFSRYSGAGSQRYPIGFSGDSVISWESLAFQPFFTATASNIGYSWWSHDIGGHYGGSRDDELNVRWVQFGVFSPVNRLHSCKASFSGKEPWNYDCHAETVIKHFLRLRHHMFPYLYTMNHRNHHELLPLILPMYYTHPEAEEAYQVPNQYWFGSETIVVPITEKGSPVTKMGKAKAWLPEGKWIDFFNGDVYQGNRYAELHRPLDSLPVLCKPGAIVPCQTLNEHDNRLGNHTDMEIYAFPGADHTFVLYEDEGDRNRYQSGHFANTKMVWSWEEAPVFTVYPATGDSSLLPQTRNWKIHFRGVQSDVQAVVKTEGETVEAEYTYDSGTNTLNVIIPDASVLKAIEIRLSNPLANIMCDNQNYKDRCYHVLLHAQMDFNFKNDIFHDIICSEMTLKEKRKRLKLAVLDKDLCDALTEILVNADLVIQA